MSWLQHLLPKTSDFFDTYDPALAPASGVRETTTIESGSTGTSPQSSGESQGSLPPVAGYEDSIGHLQANVANAGSLTNPNHPPLRDSAPEGHEQGLMNKPFRSKSVLKEMLKHVIPGARYNSSARYPPPRCCPGTRTHILRDVGTRIGDKDTRIIWLSGLAGSGKTAVMQTLAETYSSRVTSATLFLSRDLRDDPNRIFTTLAYGFAVANLAYRHFVEGEMALDPDFLSLSITEQFQTLFIQPFLKHVIPDTQRWVIFLDGLDECRGDANQCSIIDLIHDSILLHPESIPILWIISSRPEAHLRSSFAAVKEDITGFLEKEVPINTQDASKDVERYLRVELTNISKVNRYSIPSRSWPVEKEVLELADTCSGFFLFASLALDYVSCVNVASRLNAFSSNHMLDPQSLTPSSFSGSQQEKRLRLTYSQVMSSIPEDIMPCTKAILGFYALQHIFPICSAPGSVGLEHLDLITVCNILDVEEHNAYAALLPLSSLVIAPSPEEAGNFGIQFLHSSFLDFLHTSFLDLGGRVDKIWQCYLRILRQFKEKRDPSGIHVCWPVSEGVDKLQEALFEIARHGWMALLINYHYDSSDPRASKIAFYPPLHSETINAFQEFGPNLTAYFAEAQIPEFMEWISKYAPSELKETLVPRSYYEPTSLGGLGTDRVFQAISAQRYCCRIIISSKWGTLAIADVNSPPTSVSTIASGVANSVRPNQGSGSGASGQGQGWNTSSIIGELATIRASRRDAPVLILRSSESGEACAVVGPITGHDPLGDLYYILPY